MSFVVAILCIISIILISILIFWTIYLVSIGRTTYEKIKQEKLLTPNIYDRGIYTFTKIFLLYSVKEVT
jgi:hypothetical protein